MSAPTPQQRAAITARGNVLVAAGAGTGKTRTIVERCRQLVFEEGCPLDRILMVTFTEAAAAEMRERIREALRQKLSEQKQTPGESGGARHSVRTELSQETGRTLERRARSDAPYQASHALAGFDSRRHLEEQLALLDTAPISTLHSFCLDLVRRHFYQLGLDPQFTVLDEQQTAPLIHQVLDELFHRHYAVAAEVTRRNANSPRNHPPPHVGGYGLRELVRSYGRGSDEPIRKLVVQIHRHTQALASPDRWFAEQVANFSEASPAGWRQAFVEGVAEWAALWREVLPAFTAESRNVAASAAALASLPGQPSFDEATKAVAAVVAADAVDWRGTKGKFRDPIKLFFTDAAFLHELSLNGGEALTQDWAWTREPMLALLELAREFTDAFTRAKRELGGIDFADQEQLALRLLYDDAVPVSADSPLPAFGHPLPSSDEGRGSKSSRTREHFRLTPVALACRERFRFVFVDECQDINAAQDAILRAVSHSPRQRAGHRTETQHLPDLSRGEASEANRFLVGDVKQSIYRFRLADPRIFQAYEAQWKQPGAGGKFLPLSGNFRSREALLEFINPLFRALMRPVIGGVSYDADAELQFGNRAERLPLSLDARAPLPVAGQEKVGRVTPCAPPIETVASNGAHGVTRPTKEAADAERWPRPDEVSPRVELHLIAKASDGDENTNHEEGEDESAELLNLQTEEREARLIARRLKELKASGHRVWDRKQERFKLVSYDDMVVLMRGIGARAEAFAKEFHLAGVPLHAERAGFFDALEVTDLLNLLRLLDNPLQDVPLLAVLRSPLVGLSADELVDVRLAHRNGLMWTALARWHEVQSSKLGSVANDQSFAVDGAIPKLRNQDFELRTCESSRGIEVHPLTPSLSPEGERVPEGQVRGWLADASTFDASGVVGLRTGENTFHKVNEFLKGFAGWRELIRHASLSQCLETALTETHYEALLLAGERGPERVANVRRLADLARRFDPYQREGLFRFLRFIDEQEKAEVRHEPATLSSGNAVRLMTIHQSKGQEFPVVVVAGLGNAFNLRDLYGDILLQEDLGLCPKVLPPGGRRRFPSLAHWLAAQRERRALLGEELRLLYVAMTRAQDTLVLTGAASKEFRVPGSEFRVATASRADQLGTRNSELGTSPPPITDFALLKARCYLDWLRLWLPHGTTAADWQNDREGANDLLRWRIYDPLEGVFARPNASGKLREVLEAPALPTQTEFATLKARLTWRYSHDAATAAPAKRSVTALIRSQVEADEETAPLFQFRVPSSGFRVHSAPKGAASKMSAAEVGTAHHRFLQLVSLDGVDNLAALEREGDRLRTAQLLSPEEVAALDLAAIARFWQSEVGQKIRANAGLVRREVPFTLRLTREDLVAAAQPAAVPEGEYVVLQGVIDLAVLLAGEIWLVDFKTDDLKPAELDEKQQDYAPQLNLYALALERIFCRPVKERWLHFLTLGKTVSV